MKKICAMLCSTLLLLLYGCSGGDERNHPLFRKGESAQKAGQAVEAVGYYKELLKRRGNCVYVHLKLANIYDELLKDPQLAALHYRLYLEANPDAVDAPEVKAWQKHAEKRYYESLRDKFAPSAVPPAPSVANAPAAVKTPDEIKLEISAAMPGTDSEKLEQAVAQVIEKAVKDAALPDLLHYSSVCSKDGKYLCTLTFKSSADPAAILKSVQELLKNTEALLPEAAVKQGIKLQMKNAPAAAVTEEIAALRKKVQEQEKTISQYRARYRQMLLELKRHREFRDAVADQSAAGKTADNTAGQGGIQKYKVVPGDTLGRIARKFYGKSSLYYVILNANPKVNGRSLKPGTILVIPEYNP